MLISILACSLGFHTITFECSTSTMYANQASAAMNPLVSFFGCLVARSGRKRGNRQTDGRNDRLLSTHLNPLHSQSPVLLFGRNGL